MAKKQRCPDCKEWKKSLERHAPYCKAKLVAKPAESDVQLVVDVARLEAEKRGEGDSPRQAEVGSVGDGVEQENKSLEEQAGDSSGVAGKSEIVISNPPPMSAPVAQVTLPSQPKTPEKKRKVDDDDLPFERKEWEEYIADTMMMCGEGTDAVMGAITEDLKGVWLFKEKELRLPSKILARKLERADITSKEAENMLLGVTGFFALAPRTAVTTVHLVKLIRNIRAKRQQPAEITHAEPAQAEVVQASNDTDELEKIKAEAKARWKANTPK
jgi:hypothetical protein